VYCETCKSGEDEENMLLCDGCNLGFHMKCLIPQLENIPEGDWFCLSCIEMKKRRLKRNKTELRAEKKDKVKNREKGKAPKRMKYNNLDKFIDAERQTFKKLLSIMSDNTLESVLKSTIFEYEDDLKKILNSFGLPDASPQIIQLVEIIALTFVQTVLDRVVEDVIDDFKSKKKDPMTKTSLIRKVNLDQISRPLSDHKKERMKDVVTFLRKKKKLQQINKDVEEDFFEEDKSVELLDSENQCISNDQILELESFWGSILMGESSDHTKKRKLKRLEYRDQLTKDLTQQEYIKFADCSKTSFTRPQKRNKFIEWCKLNTYPITFNNECLDVLGQMTYELIEDVIRGTIEMFGKIEFFDVIQYLKKNSIEENGYSSPLHQ